MKIGLVVPHIFLHAEIFGNVIFAPGELAIQLTRGLLDKGHEVTLFSPGFDVEGARNVHPDMSLFEEELAARGDTYTELLKKHPLVFISLARQVQSELIARAYKMAREFDIIHVYCNEEELAMAFSDFCTAPLVFTHHEPFSYLARYRSSFPKYRDKNWISISYSQRASMPPDTNFVANIYHGLDSSRFHPIENPTSDYLLYFGRIIEPKGVHLAIETAKRLGMPLKIVGKHYSGHGKDEYWEERIVPHIDGKLISYGGFVSTDAQKNEILGNAKALLVPSIWPEPFGMVMIEALACGTPVIGLANGSIPEILDEGKNGFLVSDKAEDGNFSESVAVSGLCRAVANLDSIDRANCRKIFDGRFTLDRMVDEHLATYESLLQQTKI